MLSNCGAREDYWWFLGQQGDQTCQAWRKSTLNVHWKDQCCSWTSNALSTWWEELTRWKRPWCWERVKAGGEGDNRGWDGWMASLTRWTWIWANCERWWRTGKPGMLQSIGSQRVGQDLATEQQQNWRGGGTCLPGEGQGQGSTPGPPGSTASCL